MIAIQDRVECYVWTDSTVKAKSVLAASITAENSTTDTTHNLTKRQRRYSVVVR